MLARHGDELQLISTDITKEQKLDGAFAKIESENGPVQCCVALASLDLSVLPQTESICDAHSRDWQRVFDVNIHGTFNTARRWLQGIRSHTSTHPERLQNVNLILMGSESGKFGVRGCAAYAAAKAAVQYGLLQSLAKDAPRVYRNARVNAVAPGAVDTTRFRDECQKFGKEWEWEECRATVPMAKSVPAEDVARTVVFLASEKWSGTTHGQVLHVDGGKTGSVAWRLGEDEA
ncbi:hypothetical protein AC579_8520 [Pseudocercospora musae]|uniref:Ketoreductase (KR) domain-containing protein n=1 Tax=Pseudocercospora musae TaxID=113226 RepID=A0A139IA36_9PEZI|nr:hypothetical protein AC579_8520 [Pseudocercospora musae]KXT11500.1 hypothetical protein AC579_8520 [Pseudocercospora musae]